ncbi:A24 family peptidase [Paenibacillus piscarius]|uniref:A24 family peptidase n=1 Tax=Paenibacillus piscarius TaxID=1089681 RepID=UPI001EE7BAC0|nr:A24 family peptidase [Paenibacillus piscarius]
MATVNMLLIICLIMLCCWFSYTDITERRISNKLTYPAILSLLVLRIGFSPEYLWGLVPGAVLFLVFMINPRAHGAGDIKLIALIGMSVGFERTISALLMMCIFVYLYLGYTKLRSGKLPNSIPLSPFLSLGLFVVLQISIKTIGGY